MSGSLPCRSRGGDARSPASTVWVVGLFSRCLPGDHDAAEVVVDDGVPRRVRRRASPRSGPGPAPPRSRWPGPHPVQPCNLPRRRCVGRCRDRPRRVERMVWLVVSGLTGHGPDRPCGHVGRVGGEHVDGAAQVDGQGSEQVAGEDQRVRQVRTGTGCGRGVDVHSDHPSGSPSRRHRVRDRPDATAQVDDGRAVACGVGGHARRAARYGAGGRTRPVQRSAGHRRRRPIRPRAQRFPGHPSRHERGDVGVVGLEQDASLVLGEHAPAARSSSTTS